tara:strand:+ start:152 stop:655 length:504 start_codon:yes stop_codon:yes gene_type:complete
MCHTSLFKLTNILKIRFYIFLSILIIACGLATLTFASKDEQFETRFIKLSNELRCPTCQGLSVKDSDAGFSTSIKLKIRELMKKGDSDEEIMAYFVDRYGEWILRSPSVSGFNILLWVLPGTTIVAGLIWVLFSSKNWIEKPTKEITEITPEEEQKIMDDLDRFEKS